MPVGDRTSHRAYVVMVALAWTLTHDSRCCFPYPDVSQKYQAEKQAV